nr:PREDICTED: transcription factor HES-1-like [Opisthocomus hoazin]
MPISSLPSIASPRAGFTQRLRKPLIERKRRERINNCLDQLKETVVGAFHLDSKLEKADILEMTVKHLQNIQSSKLLVVAAAPRHVLQPNFSHNSPRMGSLDMWRPW